jgi:hypothetical protein
MISAPPIWGFNKISGRARRLARTERDGIVVLDRRDGRIVALPTHLTDRANGAE